MGSEQRQAEFLAKAREADERSDQAGDSYTRDAWKRIADDYRALAEIDKKRRH